MNGTCQHECGPQTLQKSIRRDIDLHHFESLLNITKLPVRLAQTITKTYRNKVL